MKLIKRYIKCYSEEKSEELKLAGYRYLYQDNGVYFFENNKDLSVKFSNSDILKDIKFSSWIGL
jgi:hypothetical protein